jgi:EAL domain-containing protein (putative c-di-GMP-specific phosphodiesterase class I)/GGDEF domain-containing protein
VRSDEAENPADSRNYEFIYVPQGRERVLLVVRDISDSSDALTRIRQLAYTDEVTRLPNREFLMQELTKVTEMQRLKEGRSAVMCIHVETLDERANALMASHEDDLLKELASRLTMQLRGMNDQRQIDYDRYSVLARTDFRQFTVLLPNIETGEDAESVMLRLLGVLSQPLSLGGHSVGATAKGGVALFPQDGTDADSLYRNALAALHDARNAESESFRFHSGTVRLRNLQRQDIAADLKTALERESFTVNFLPAVDAQSGATHSIEALLRWPTTVLGAQSTRKIVAIAEYTGLITDIGEWVLRRACEQLVACRVAGHDHVRVSVNLSNQEFAAVDLVDRVAAVLDDTGVDPADLQLEVREHMVFRDALQAHSTCSALKSLGVDIVIDDYGTGACTLAHLSQSPADAIKIDLSFVANIESSERDRAACTAAIALAHGLGMRVIAEGVETERQAEFLRDSGCDALQGFLFSRPMTGDEVLAYLDDAARREDSRSRAS